MQTSILLITLSGWPLLLCEILPDLMNSFSNSSDNSTESFSLSDIVTLMSRKAHEACKVDLFKTSMVQEDGERCNVIEEMCENVGLNCTNSSRLSKEELEKLAPKLFINLANNCDSLFATDNSSASILKSWLINFSLVTLINLLSVSGIWMYAAFKQSVRTQILLYFMSFGAGVLNANGLVHLIPGSFGFDPAEDSRYVWKSVVCLCGVFSFIVLDCSFKIFCAFRNNNFNFSRSEELIVNSSTLSDSENSDRHHRFNLPDKFYSPVFLYPGVASYALLIIVGDACHNLLDGLAIGASFASSHKQGYTTFLAVASEELPQEIGDFCALVFAGLNNKQAIFWNLMSSLSCYIGAFFGLMFGQNPKIGYYIDAFCGGMFVYISLHGILPEVVTEIVNISRKKPWDLVHRLFYMLISIFCGMAFMVIMAFVSLYI